MIFRRLIIIVFMVIVAQGCQQSHYQKIQPAEIKIKKPVQTKVADEKEPTRIFAAAPKELPTTADPVSVDLSFNPQAAEPKEKIDPENLDSNQAKADQALELCHLAQKMWEKGKLDEALSNLDNAYYLILEIDNPSFSEISQQKEDIRFLISKRILEIYASRQISATGNYDEIPITLNAHVKREINRLIGPEKKYLIRALERSSRYRPAIVRELKKAGLPEEISWLPLIESGFKLKALSPARALGLWQFIPSTGYKFGLTRNYYIDERMDPEKSTRAAIAYLKELHRLFGDWTTALAAYNCGEGRVLKTIRRQKINYLDNFWDLYQNLPRETARYVPRFIAIVHIINNLEKYHITLKNPLAPIPFQTFKVKRQIRLKDISRQTGISLAQLKDLNPELRYALLPPDNYTLKIPLKDASRFSAQLDKIKSTYSPSPVFVYHRVRKGDTLSGIADRYKTSVRAISRANHIYKTNKIRAGKVLKIPGRRQYSANRTPAVKVKSARPASYTVRRGDNLWKIARKFSTSTKKIMIDNRLSDSNLTVGQPLIIAPEGPRIASKSSSTGTYKVQCGDSPFLIAKKHNMALNRLLALNRLNKKSKIYPGQKLIVE